MAQHHEIIDLKFGLSQLSGNHDLLVKLLGKFSMEYQDLAEKLDEMNAQENMAAYKQAVHTVKGVSGNLGLNALHQAAKTLEANVINGIDHDTSYRQFTSILDETLNQIAALSSETEQGNEEKQSITTENNGLNALKKSLEQNQFIPPDELTAILSDCGFSEVLKEQVSAAISDLDYPLALNLLDSQ